MRSKEELKAIVKPHMERIVEAMRAELESLTAILEPGLERNSVVVSMDIDLAAIITAGALMLAGPTYIEEITSRIRERTVRFVEHYTGANAGPDAAKINTPGNGTLH
jgi:hypothetical protein